MALGRSPHASIIVLTQRTKICHSTYSSTFAANSHHGTRKAAWRARCFLSSRALRTRLSKFPSHPQPVFWGRPPKLSVGLLLYQFAPPAKLPLLESSEGIGRLNPSGCRLDSLPKLVTFQNSMEFCQQCQGRRSRASRASARARNRPRNFPALDQPQILGFWVRWRAQDGHCRDRGTEAASLTIKFCCSKRGAPYLRIRFRLQSKTVNDRQCECGLRV